MNLCYLVKWVGGVSLVGWLSLSVDWFRDEQFRSLCHVYLAVLLAILNKDSMIDSFASNNL